MPEISRFLEIVIAMYYREHSPPHYHARYGEHRASIDVESGEIIAGDLPRRAARLVREWHGLHELELRENWDLAMSRDALNKIEPLE